ncbi:MAG: hydrogenase maturation protease [Methylotenera sp.]|nr:hydrogenase maturation protease [Methylotenera sp.]
MTAPFLIFAVGNESRGDDGLGPLLLRDLASWLMTNSLSEQFELIEEFQLQIEHALDMKGRQLVLVIDAGIHTRSPFEFYRAQACDTPVLYSHALAPEALLKVYAKFYQEAPPAVFILCIAGDHFELGESLSVKTADRLATAFEFCKKLLSRPNTSNWGELLTR